MTPPRIGKTQMSLQLRERAGLSHDQAERAVDGLIAIVEEHLVKGGAISFPRIGKLSVEEIRNRKRVTFLPDALLQRELNAE